MSIKNSHVTSDYIEWDSMLSLVRKLFRDGEYRLSLLIGCGCFFGLRISDLLSLDWTMILDDTKFTLIEKKTGKRREIRINEDFQKHIHDCYTALKITDKHEKCFISRKKTVYSTQRINVLFIIRKSKFPQNPKRSVRFSGKRTKRSVQKRKARNTQKAETKVL